MNGMLSKDQMLMLSQSNKSRYNQNYKVGNHSSLEQNKKCMDSYLDSLIVN